MTRLLKSTMRMRPDRIIVGEVRGKEALDLLKAWNTGHPGGIGTVHANDARAALVRIGMLVQEANVPPNPELIAEAVNVVVSIRRTATGRIVDEVLAVKGFENGGFLTESL
jgi:type IV secretion system protein VirB11